MTIVNTATGELISESQVRASIQRVISHAESIWDEWAWQVENQTWNVLGYESWDEMRRGEYGALTSVAAPRAERPELVARFRGAGLTQRQTADTLGIGQATVSRLDESDNSGTGRPRLIQMDNSESDIGDLASRGQARPSSYMTTSKPERRDPAQLAEAAVRDFAELTYYRDLGDLSSCIAIAHDLRTFAEPELTRRRSILKRSIEVDQDDRRGIGSPVVTEAPAPPKTCPTCGQTVRD